ncbi:lecithin retinol acyltransferase-like [Durio zibethinus]|uniref:Lecithin retinol acyltransferase-like n=1 Tax=Durio zibethinus TaxID=66656 RepID=A0A6P5WX22_DURZI|nr:lecithin retinol acyltransferase-like [Durio zibethinus]
MGPQQSMLFPPPPIINPLPFPGLIPDYPNPNPNRKPEPGDHIYSERSGGLYDHHGIYVGDDMVIHLQGPAKQKHIGSSAPCQKCGYKRDFIGGVIKTCLDCFLDGHSLHFYEYGVPFVVFNRRRRGTCHVGHSKPAYEVIKTATDFLEGNGFGCYDMFANNCEDFAVYCKTGTAISHQVMGHIGNPLVTIGLGPLGVGLTGAYGLAKVITEAQRRR